MLSKKQNAGKRKLTFGRRYLNNVRRSSAVFCYDLMNEPVAPAGPTKGKEWLGLRLAGSILCKWISREQRERPRHEIAAQWIKTLVGAIRQQDQQHLITVGLVDWSLERPGLQSGFVPEKIHAELDFLQCICIPNMAKRSSIGNVARFRRGEAGHCGGNILP